MKTVTFEQVLGALRSLGLGHGDGVLVHSAIQFLGKPLGGAEIYWRALQEILGSDGTVVVPTFNFQFASGKPYDPSSTPSVGMGSLAELIRTLPDAQRSPHPMQSLAVIGKYARDIAGRDTPCAFDAGSAFERLLALDFWIVLLGADIYAASLVHYSEQRAEVPYRYWKDFTGQVLTACGWQERTYRMFVRDLELNPTLDLSPIERSLRKKDEWREVPLNYGRIALFRAKAFMAATDELLKNDPWSLALLPDDAQRDLITPADEVL